MHNTNRTNTQVIVLFAIDAIGSIPEFIYVFDTSAFPLKYLYANRGA